MALLQAAYMFGAAGYPSMNIGINQLGHLGLPAAAASLLAVWPTAVGVSAPAVRKLGAGIQLPKRIPAILLEVLVAGLSVSIFLSLCNRFINRDGLNLFTKIPRDVARYGAHLTHDEMLELYVHSRLYYYAQQAFGWSVGKCYQVASAVAGGGFVLILLRASRAWAPRSRLAFIGLVLSCGFVQLFFGDVENYTLVTLMILVYLAAASRYLDGRAPLWWPSLALSIAIGFHLLAGWLLPSLAYLFLHARRQARTREMAAGLAALILPLAWLLAFFHFSGLPIQRLWQSSHLGGMGGHFGQELSPLDPGYHWGMLNVMLLLWPTAVIVPALAAFKRLGSDPLSRFLQVASGAMLVFTFVWKAELGFLEDWNLFAPGMVPAAILVARSLCQLPPSRWRILVILALFGTAGLHTAVWVLSNHFVSR